MEESEKLKDLEARFFTLCEHLEQAYTELSLLEITPTKRHADELQRKLVLTSGVFEGICVRAKQINVRLLAKEKSSN